MPLTISPQRIIPIKARNIATTGVKLASSTVCAALTGDRANLAQNTAAFYAGFDAIGAALKEVGLVKNYNPLNLVEAAITLLTKSLKK